MGQWHPSIFPFLGLRGIFVLLTHVFQLLAARGFIELCQIFTQVFEAMKLVEGCFSSDLAVALSAEDAFGSEND